MLKNLNVQQYTAATVIQSSGAECLTYCKYLSDTFKSHSHVFAH